MKVPVRKLDEERVRLDYPIDGGVPGWFFRMREISNCAWLIEGADLWGRQVSSSGSDEQQLLREFVAAAERIRADVDAASPRGK